MSGRGTGRSVAALGQPLSPNCAVLPGGVGPGRGAGDLEPRTTRKTRTPFRKGLQDDVPGDFGGGCAKPRVRTFDQAQRR